MSFNAIQEIRKKTREEWVQIPRDKYTDLRIWIQENPEKAFVAGIVTGIILILAWRVFLGLAFIAAIVAAVVYNIALPGAAPAQPEDAASTPEAGTTEK